MRQLLLTCVLLTAALPAVAAPVTYACTYAPTPFLSELAGIDQIVVDSEAETIEFRVSNTMGTANQVNWLFKDGDTEDDRLLWKRTFDGDRVSGTRIGLPFIFERMGTHFGLSFADGLPFLYHAWTCAN